MRGFAWVLGITISGTIVLTAPVQVSAQSNDGTNSSSLSVSELSEEEFNQLFKKEKSYVLDDLLAREELQEEPMVEVASANIEEAEPEPTVHVVKSGEHLSKIAKDHDTTWIRIWQKNTELDHPDRVDVGDELVIPHEDEELEIRELPVPVTSVEPTPAPAAAPAPTAARSPAASTSSRQQVNTAPAPAPARSAQAVQPRGSSSGNLYTAGYCTWYAKNRRPDLPNNLGNANTWFQRARAQGIPTGSQPRVGAIAATTSGAYGHVAYVQSVNGDGTVTVSEMNWRGLHIVSTRTAPASSFNYIY